jgi:hypothetical protein
MVKGLNLKYPYRRLYNPLVLQHTALLFSLSFFLNNRIILKANVLFFTKDIPLFLLTLLLLKVKGKAIPFQAWSDPECSRKLRFPDFITTAQDGGNVVSLTDRPPLSPGNTPGTHFC